MAGVACGKPCVASQTDAPMCSCSDCGVPCTCGMFTSCICVPCLLLLWLSCKVTAVLASAMRISYAIGARSLCVPGSCGVVGKYPWVGGKYPWFVVVLHATPTRFGVEWTSAGLAPAVDGIRVSCPCWGLNPGSLGRCWPTRIPVHTCKKQTNKQTIPANPD